MKKYFYLLLSFTLTLFHVQAQNEGKSDLISIKVVASGKTETLALTEALRSALTQTSSVFISANTTIINDQISKDEIAMINNGSIAGYKLVDKHENTDGTVSITYEVTVSVNKLTSFVESTGGATELKGSLFAANIKLQELNEKAEQKAVEDLITVSQTILKNSFDYKIENGEPTEQNGKWKIPLIISITKNKNYDEFVKFFSASLAGISMNKAEQDAYIKLNKQLYAIGLFDNSKLTINTPSVARYHSTQESIQGLSSMNSDIELFENKFYINKKGNYEAIFLRNEFSYKSLENFVINVERELFSDLVITNGVTDELIGRQERYKISGYLSNINLSFVSSETVPIVRNGFAYLGGNMFNENKKNLIDPGITGIWFGWNWEKFKSPVVVQLRNDFWESRMVGFNEKRNTWMSFQDLSTDLTTINFFEGYLDYIFGNYILHVKKVNNLNYEYQAQHKNSNPKSIISFPLQLTSIGNDAGEVYKLYLDNTLLTEEISQVSEYRVKVDTRK